MLRALSDVQLDLITFVVFNRIDIALDVLQGSTDGFPGRARLGVVEVGLGRIALLRDMAGCVGCCLRRRVAGVARLLVFRVLGQRRGHRQRNNGHCAHQDGENLLSYVPHNETSLQRESQFQPRTLQQGVCRSAVRN